MHGEEWRGAGWPCRPAWSPVLLSRARPSLRTAGGHAGTAEKGDGTFRHLLTGHLSGLTSLFLLPPISSSAGRVNSFGVGQFCSVGSSEDAGTWRAGRATGVRASPGGPSVPPLPEGLGARVWRRSGQWRIRGGPGRLG